MPCLLNQQTQTSDRLLHGWIVTIYRVQSLAGSGLEQCSNPQWISGFSSLFRRRSLISLGHQERSETFIMLDLETLRGSCGGSFLFLLISSFNALRMHLTANPVSVCLSRRSGGKVELLLFRDFPCNNILLPGVGRSPLMPQWAQISPLQLRRNADDGCLEPIWFNATTFALILTGQFDPVSSWGRLSNVELREPRNFTTYYILEPFLLNSPAA
ncbi:hypothetical protein BDV35DRAFT_288283 [Aspergillus flavus]|uniref:Uncharacterized protein n=1 Tax=Aspergillus flavus TaxID=5059 RepID=A0A5N6GQ36_ASPFL|nr:hypothetical protein BDV35DRAFT_288283 [Aspergillus flavus]